MALPLFVVAAFVVNKVFASGDATWMIWATVAIGVGVSLANGFTGRSWGGLSLVVAWLLWPCLLVLGSVTEAAGPRADQAGLQQAGPMVTAAVEPGSMASGAEDNTASACAAFEATTQAYIRGQLSDAGAAAGWRAQMQQADGALQKALAGYLTVFEAGGNPAPSLVRQHC